MSTISTLRARFSRNQEGANTRRRILYVFGQPWATYFQRQRLIPLSSPTPVLAMGTSSCSIRRGGGALFQARADSSEITACPSACLSHRGFLRRRPEEVRVEGMRELDLHWNRRGYNWNVECAPPRVMMIVDSSYHRQTFGQILLSFHPAF